MAEETNPAPIEEPVDQPAGEAVPAAGHQAETGRLQRLKSWYLDKKKWTIPASVLVLILILAGIPVTRYGLAGLVHKRDLEVRVIDATAGTPVSGATVSVGSISAETSGTGAANLHNIKLGNQTLMVSKKYYKSTTYKVLAPIGHQKTVPSIQLTATGRQVKISVVNSINKQVLSNVEIKLADVSAKTDKDGNAVVVLPAGATQQPATLSLAGYNDAAVTVKVSNNQVQQNSYTLTPAGKVYFLSKLSGKIDVVKTNLDGTGRQTVLAGTGKEDDQNTVLLASKDWKYLALLSKRAGSNPTLYLIDTSNDSLTTIDEGNVSFQLIGWSDSYFNYVVNRSDFQPWQPKASSIKSYNAQTKQLAILDSTNATGSSAADADYETYIVQPILLDNLIVYAKTWYHYPGYLQVASQSNTLNAIKPNNTGKKTIKSVDASQSYFGSLVFHSPESIYVQISNFDNSPSTYYETNGLGLTQKSNLSNDDLFKTYPTYLYSPDDSQTFWSEPRDGKNTLFVGDDQGQNGKQIATLSDYNTYGWYTGNYLLVSKNSSELYIMPKGGSANPIKISDYHKPALSFQGYGGGYGGF